MKLSAKDEPSSVKKAKCRIDSAPLQKETHLHMKKDGKLNLPLCIVKTFRECLRENNYNRWYHFITHGVSSDEGQSTIELPNEIFN